MKKLITFILIAALGTGLGLSLNASKVHTDSSKKVLATQVKQEATIPVKQVYGIPKYVKIPKIGVATNVESVGIDAQGRMDIPKNSDNTAWFDLGYRPGQNGMAVLDGHYDKADGSGAVFWDIAKLQKGDKILLTDDSGKEITFVVTKLSKYPYDMFPIKSVFGESSVPMLNLITCHGQWNKSTKNYSQRLVVYSELAKSNE